MMRKEGGFVWDVEFAEKLERGITHSMRGLWVCAFGMCHGKE
jgi:hypothetical protein